MMLNFNRLYKLTTLLFLSAVLPVQVFAQGEDTSEKSIIVMTKSELNSFLNTIVDARRSQLNEKENRSVKQDLAELRLKYNESSRMGTGYGNVSNDQILRELSYLNQRIDNLGSNNNRLPSTSTRDNSTIIMPSNSSPSNVYPNSGKSATTIIPSNKNKIQELQYKIDSLKNVDANKPTKNDTALTDSLYNVNLKLNGLRKHLDSLESKMMKTDKVAVKNVSPENRSYFKQPVYFANNSSTLNATYFTHIQDLTQILVKYPEAKVILEGWASPLGSANSNKQLSMRRAEAVEKAFKNNGIDPERILTSFRGEDNSSTEQHARRVDMAIIVR